MPAQKAHHARPKSLVLGARKFHTSRAAPCAAQSSCTAATEQAADELRALTVCHRKHVHATRRAQHFRQHSAHRSLRTRFFQETNTPPQAPKRKPAPAPLAAPRTTRAFLPRKRLPHLHVLRAQNTPTKPFPTTHRAGMPPKQTHSSICMHAAPKIHAPAEPARFPLRQPTPPKSLSTAVAPLAARQKLDCNSGYSHYTISAAHFINHQDYVYIYGSFGALCNPPFSYKTWLLRSQPYPCSANFNTPLLHAFLFKVLKKGTSSCCQSEPQQLGCQNCQPATPLSRSS